MNNLQNTISFRTLTELLSPTRKEFRRYTLKDTPDAGDSRPFSYLEVNNTAYIEPTLSRQLTSEGMTPPSEAKIILISAPAATGKSMMTSQLSSRLGMPCFNLALNEPVGKDSLIGMLYHTLNMADLPAFLTGLKGGTQSMIIDALDEGAVATGQAPFDSFLKDIADLARDAAGIPFVIMGRTSVLEYASLLLEDSGIPVAWLKINPFAKKDALRFISVKLGYKEFKEMNTTLKNVVEFIFTSLGSCLRSGRADEKTMSDFLGYAPVLDTITKMLKDQPHHQQLLEELKAKGNRNITLLRDIIEKIMSRERDKILKAVESLFSKYPSSFKERLYTREEQLCRLMHSLAKTTFEAKPTDDAEFNREYDKMATRWFEAHPFIPNGKIENPVFESYVLAMSAKKENLLPALERCLADRTAPSLFFDFFCIDLEENQTIDYSLVSFLISSFQEEDTSEDRSTVEIYEDTENGSDTDNNVLCRINFTRSNDNDSISMLIAVPSDARLRLGRTISSLTVDAPLDIVLDSRRTDFCAPVDINVHSLLITSNELVFTPGIKSPLPSVLISSTRLDSRLESGIQQVTKRGNIKISVSTESQLYFPLVEYKAQTQGKDSDASVDELFPKFRRLILYFRANGKDEMGRFKDKIDKLIAGNHAGRKVLNALMKKNIITSDTSMYYLDADSLSKTLNTSFSSIRSCERSEELNTFLASLISTENS